MPKYEKLFCIVTLLVAVIGLSPMKATALCTNYSTSRLVGRLNDTLVNEASGLVASRQYPGVFWVHNDSGDSARLFAFYIRCGKAYSLGYFTVDGISAGNTVDWEDISIGPGPDGRQWIYVGDFGNNGGSRNNARNGFLRLVRFPEPRVTIPAVDSITPPGNLGSTEAGRTEILPFKYPQQAEVPSNGEYDQEGFAVHPYHGRAYIITKRIGNTQTAVQHAYALNLDDPLWISTLAVNWSSPIKTNALRLTNPVGIYGQITGMDISPDGLRTVVRESTVGWVYTSTGATRDAFEQSWTTTPDQFTADIAQDEAITFSHDGEYIYHVPEGAMPQVHRVNGAGAPFIQDLSGAITAPDQYTLTFNTKDSGGTAVTSTARITWGSSFPPAQVIDLSAAASNHAVVLRGLQPSQTYLYQISTQRQDSSGNLLGDIYECSFYVGADLPLELVAGPTLNIAKASVIVAWETSIPANGEVKYATVENAAAGSWSYASSAELVTQHSISLQNLVPAHDYLYRIRSNAGTKALRHPASGELPFHSGGDVTPPAAPEGLRLELRP